MSRPWAAQDAGSRSVASMLERFLILKTRPARCVWSTKRSLLFLLYGCFPTGSHTRICAVFGKPAVHGDAVGLEILTEQFVSAPAVEALPAELRVVSNNSVSHVETLGLGTEPGNFANGLMACIWRSTVRKVNKRYVCECGQLQSYREREGTVMARQENLSVTESMRRTSRNGTTSVTFARNSPS